MSIHDLFSVVISVLEREREREIERELTDKEKEKTERLGGGAS